VFHINERMQPEYSTNATPTTIVIGSPCKKPLDRITRRFGIHPLLFQILIGVLRYL